MPRMLGRVGPGLITGAADDDPSGIATYSQAGAQLGLHSMWTVLFAWPLVVAVQAICARLALVTGKGLAWSLNEVLPRRVLVALVFLLIAANTLNIAADLAAIGDAVQLLVGGPQHLYSLGFGILSVLLQVFIPYQRYVKFLKWLTLSLFAYVGVVLAIPVPWGTVIKDTLLPTLSLSPVYIAAVVAIFGTTISPYLFFWQASQEIEERRSEKRGAFSTAEMSDNLRHVRNDTAFGMGISCGMAFFIMLTTALTLNANGITDIQTSAQAAEALRPIVGDLAFLLFALGIVGTGLLAVPVLAASAAYAAADTLKIPGSLGHKPHEARGFYAIITVATLAGVALDFTPIDPIKALYYSAIVNGIVAVPLMAAIMLAAGSKRLLGPFTISGKLRSLGWAATAVMTISVTAFFVNLQKA